MGVDWSRAIRNGISALIMLPVAVIILAYPLIVFIIAYKAGIVFRSIEATMMGAVLELALAALFLALLKDKADVVKRLAKQSVKGTISMVLLWFIQIADFNDDSGEELPMVLAGIAVVSSVAWVALTVLAVYALGS